jgi:uncharacterized protein YoxC
MHSLQQLRAGRARAWAVLALVPVTLGISACGESKEEKAEKQVCSAKADINTKVTSLKSLTPTTASVSQIKTDVNGIVEDLKTIRSALPDLSSPRKEEVTKATEEFGKEAAEAVSKLKTTGSIASTEAALKEALGGLASAYEKALAPLQCS